MQMVHNLLQILYKPKANTIQTYTNTLQFTTNIVQITLCTNVTQNQHNYSITSLMTIKCLTKTQVMQNKTSFDAQNYNNNTTLRSPNIWLLPKPIHSVPKYSTPMHVVPINSIPIPHVPIHSTLVHSIPLYQMPIHHILIHPTSIHQILVQHILIHHILMLPSPSLPHFICL